MNTGETTTQTTKETETESKTREHKRERIEKRTKITREEETEGRKTKVEGGIPVSQQRAPSLIFAQNASTPPAEQVSFL
jgi:hypothetical protein